MNIAVALACNALNNLPSNQEGKVVYGTDDVRHHYERSLKPHGYTIKRFEDTTDEERRAALEWYRKNTDWSAFKKKDWIVAYEAVGGKA